MQGNLVIIAVGLVIALALSTLVTAFTTTIIWARLSRQSSISSSS
jgi:large-conductance mechanosensitive channel